MPSYRYTRAIAPEDLRPDEKPVYTKKEQRANWWRYHWGWVAGALAVVLLVCLFVSSLVRRKEADLAIGILTPAPLPEGLAVKLEEALAALVGDLNGDGTALVTVEVYTLDAADEMADAESGAPPPAEEPDSTDDLSSFMDFEMANPYNQMAGVVRLAGAYDAGSPLIFMAAPEYAQNYQDGYLLYGTADGGAPTAGAEVEAYSLAFGQVPALAALNLEVEMYDGSLLDGAAFFADYRFGMRGLEDTQLAQEDDGRARWDAVREIYEQLVA